MVTIAMRPVVLMSTIFGSSSVLVSCKVRPHSGREETEAMCLSGSARVLPPSRSVQSDQEDVLSA